tara:strand:+ start:138 stop:281 length:144 start_codon:yes stop_codon:yes gene_type:complete
VVHVKKSYYGEHMYWDEIREWNKKNRGKIYIDDKDAPSIPNWMREGK